MLETQLCAEGGRALAHFPRPVKSRRITRRRADRVWEESIPRLTIERREMEMAGFFVGVKYQMVAAHGRRARRGRGDRLFRLSVDPAGSRTVMPRGRKDRPIPSVDILTRDFHAGTEMQVYVLADGTVLLYEPFVASVRDRATGQVVEVAGARVTLLDRTPTSSEVVRARGRVLGPRVGFVDVFAGGGGAVVGLLASGYRHLLSVDMDEVACETLRRNVPMGQVLCADVRTVHWQQLVELAGEVPGHGHFSPDCKPTSSAGKRLGTADPRHVVPEMLRLLEEAAACAQLPSTISIEDAGLERMEFRPIMRDIINRLEAIGYKLYKVQCPETGEPVLPVLNAANYGVPQVRPRVIGMGCLTGVPLPPVITHPAGKWVTVREAWEGLPEPVLGEDVAPPLPNHWYLPTTRPSDPDRHKGSGTIGGTLRWDEPAGAITSMARSPETARGSFYHPTGRRMSGREAGRLQTFPDWWAFAGKQSRVFLQIGSAVPCLMQKAVGEALMPFHQGVRENQADRVA